MESNIYLVILAALLPAAVLVIYTYYRDKYKKEPIKWILKGVLYGVLSVILASIFNILPISLLGVDATNSVIHNFAIAFASAAIPEETAKWICLYLLVRKNPYFDEKVDGIVYATCVGMGFAGAENISYLCMGMDDGTWMATGIMRAIFSVPGHYAFAVAMGYFFSLAWFYEKGKNRNYILSLLVPILFHGLFDGLLFSINITVVHSVILSVLFLYFFYRMEKYAGKRIDRHLLADKMESENVQALDESDNA